MRKSLLAISVVAVVTGCQSYDQMSYNPLKQPVQKGNPELFAPYNDSVLDRDNAIVQNNKERSEVALLRRQLEELRGRLSKLSDLEKQLGDRLQQAAYETELQQTPTEKSEPGRITEFQTAVRAGQQEIAVNTVHHEQVQAEIEAELESRLATLEVEADKLITNIRSDLKLRKARLKAVAITQKASAKKSLIEDNADVVAPVVTNSDVYVYEEPKAEASRVAQINNEKIEKKVLQLEAKTVAQTQKIVASQSVQKPLAQPVVATVNTSGMVTYKPVQIQKPTRSIYDVVYVYKDKTSWNRFNALLKAHGVKDLWAVFNRKEGEFYTYVGRYNRVIDAERRKNYLAKVLHSDHAQIRSKKIYL